MKLIEDLINDPSFDINEYFGYIYLTENIETGIKYIGKKNFFHTTNKKLGKKEILNLPVARGKKPSTKQVIKESDWKTYYGSAYEVKNTSKDKLTRTLLRLCKTKKELTYFELKYQFQLGVLEDSKIWINDNIQGRFFTKDLVNI